MGSVWCGGSQTRVDPPKGTFASSGKCDERPPTPHIVVGLVGGVAFPSLRCWFALLAINAALPGIGEALVSPLIAGMCVIT